MSTSKCVRYAIGAVAVCLSLVLGSQASASEWTEYDLQGAEFAAPSDWEITYSVRDVEYNLRSPDKTFQLWVSWWFPDEPQLGYDDIVFSDTVTLADQQALLIRTESGGERLLQIAFPDFNNADGEILLVQLIAPMDLSIANHELFMRAVARKLILDGKPARFKSATPFGGDLSGEDQSRAPSPEAALPTAEAYFHENGGDFSLPYPAGWTVHRAQGQGVHQVALVSPDGDAMVLAVAGPQTDVDLVLGYLYRDAIVVNSIESEAYPEIAGQPAHAVASNAKVYAINAIRMPYDRGRVWIYRGGKAEKAFAIVSIRPSDAPDGLAATLDRIATGFVFGAPPEAAAHPAPVETITDIRIQPQVAPEQASAGREWLPELKGRLGGDCHLVSLDGWVDPTRDVMEAADVDIQFVALCQGDTYPVFGVDFAYDQQGQTSDYFYPLYLGVLEANGRNDFSFLAVSDRLLSNFALTDANSLSLSYEEFTAPAPATIKIDITPSKPADSSAELQSHDESDATVIFNGQDLAEWQTFGFGSGKFETDVDQTSDGLRWDIPENRGWAKTGLIWRGDDIDVAGLSPRRALDIVTRIDADASNSITVALVDPAKDKGDPWTGHRMRFHVLRNGGKGELQSTVRGSLPLKPIVFNWPEGLTDLHFRFRADDVLELLDGEGYRLAYRDLHGAWPEGATTLFVYGQVPGKHRPVKLHLKQISLSEVDYVTHDAVGDVGARDVVLLENGQPRPFWFPTANTKDLFDALSEVQGGALRIQWPADNARATHVGLHSLEPVIWLDRFTEGAETRIAVDLDGVATGNVLVGLQQGFNPADWSLSETAWRASWARQTDGTFTFTNGVDWEGAVTAQGLQAVPERFEIVLRPDGITVEAEGLPDVPVPFDQLVDGAGLRMWIYALNSPETGGAMTLRRLGLTHIPGPETTARPAKGVEPLPKAVVFDGQPDAAWEIYGMGGAKAEALVRQTAAGLELSCPNPTPGSDALRVGLASADKIVTMDDRLGLTGYAVTFHLDPTEPGPSGWIYLTNKLSKPKDGAIAAVSLRPVEHGPETGKFEVQFLLRSFHYNHGRRYLPPDWRESWDGSVTFVLNEGRLSLWLGETLVYSLTEPNLGIHDDARTVLSPCGGKHNRKEMREATTMTIKGVTHGWVTPDGMDGLLRQSLLEAEAFDPDTYLSALKTLLDEEVGQ